MKKNAGPTDKQLTGMAGEFLVAGKLFKRGYQVALTLGNAKRIDLFVFNEKTGKTTPVQVKTLVKKNCYLMSKDNIRENHIYVFVMLGDPEDQESFFIVRGKTILGDIDTYFGASYRNGNCSTMPAINYGPLKDHRDHWHLFDE